MFRQQAQELGFERMLPVVLRLRIHVPDDRSAETASRVSGDIWVSPGRKPGVGGNKRIQAPSRGDT